MSEKPCTDNWESYWRNNTFRRRITEWVRKNYFAKIFARAAMKHIQKGTVLEAGCGTGLISSFLNTDFITIGCDISLTALKIARKHSRYVVSCDIHKLPFKDDSIELIFNQGVMEHFSDTEFHHLLKEFKRISRKVAIILPSKTSIFRLYNPFKEVSGENVFFSKKRLMRLASEAFSEFKAKYLAKTFFISIIGYGEN